MHRRALRTRALAAAVALLASAVTLTILPSAAAQPWPTCNYTTGNYSAGSAYDDNIQQLIYNLQTNALSTPALFATGSAGEGADAVYGLILCRGDLSATDCLDCGYDAGKEVYGVCNGTRDAALVYNRCYVRLAPTDFLSSTNNTGMVGLIGPPRVPEGLDNVTVAAYNADVNRLLNTTVRYAVDSGSAAPSSPRKYFATGQRVGVDPQLQLPTGIWSMARCAGDISPAQCRSCLDDLMAQCWDRFDRSQVGARLAVEAVARDAADEVAGARGGELEFGVAAGVGGDGAARVAAGVVRRCHLQHVVVRHVLERCNCTNYTPEHQPQDGKDRNVHISE